MAPGATILNYEGEAHDVFNQGLHGVEWVNLGGGGQFQALFDGPK